MVTHPFLFAWIESDRNTWIGPIAQLIAKGYTPSVGMECSVPKCGGLVRPARILNLSDEVVYNALVGSMLTAIIPHIGWSQGGPDVAYQLQATSNIPRWVKPWFQVWQGYIQNSLQLLDEHTEIMVVSDLSAFYENIDHHRLASDLRSIGAGGESLDLLMRCLGRWADPRGKGIPQGYSASDILAKVYVSPIDQALRDQGFRHLRYVDDIRIFCRDGIEAKQALMCFESLVRRRGLNVQGAKTKMLSRDEARREIDGVNPIIREIEEELRLEIGGNHPIDAPYGTLKEISDFIRESGTVPHVSVLERAFRRFFLEEAPFEKTLFRYLLRRLGAARSPIAVDYCLGRFADKPEETSDLLSYLGNISMGQEVVGPVLDYLESDEAVYDYQTFEVLRWLYKNRTCSDRIAGLCRRVSWDRNRMLWLRSYAIAILSEYGTNADHERAEVEYANAESHLEKADCIHCLRRMEKNRRNAFYGRAIDDGDLVRRAVILAKSSVPVEAMQVGAEELEDMGEDTPLVAG